MTCDRLRVTGTNAIADENLNTSVRSFGNCGNVAMDHLGNFQNFFIERKQHIRQSFHTQVAYHFPYLASTVHVQVPFHPD
jgi:hypothetical protein